MTLHEAYKIVGYSRPIWELRNMAKALQIHSWLNTPEEELRLEAVKTILTKRG